jgi:hypothetical protein
VAKQPVGETGSTQRKTRRRLASTATTEMTKRSQHENAIGNQTKDYAIIPGSRR